MGENSVLKLGEINKTDMYVSATVYPLATGFTEIMIRQYSDDGKTLKAVPFNETNNYRRLVEQHKSIYNKLYFSGDSSAVK